MFLSIHSENSGYRMPSIICDQSAGFIICFIKMIIKRLFPIISKINLLPKKALNVEQRLTYAQSLALRPRKAKSSRKEPHYFSDAKAVRAVGGKGGDGCVSFLQLWCNERAGPDGGDGGSVKSRKLEKMKSQDVLKLGPALAETLMEMFKCGLDINKFHMVGHSLGSQMSGMIGREIYRRSNKSMQIKRITALDPAFPLFYMGKMVTHLNKRDAEFVDVIHTDAWIYGAPVSTGTADFWPNSGKTLQPGCPKRNYKMLSDNDLSSHRRSWWFWAESVSNKHPERFLSVKANSWNDFKSGKVINVEQHKVFMGHDCPPDISGDYYLQTNGITPFARDEAGIKYIDPKQLIGFIYVEPETT